MEVNGYSRSVLGGILNMAQEMLTSLKPLLKRDDGLPFTGLLFMDAKNEDVLTIKAALARSKVPSFDGSLMLGSLLSEMEFITQASIVADAVDLLVTSFHSHDNLGQGSRLANAVASNIDLPSINFSDEVYSSLGAIAELLGLVQALGTLDGKRVAISWGFGNHFHSPNVAHSLHLFLALLGIDQKMVAPSRFHLQNRVRHQASSIAKSYGAEIVHAQDFEGSFDDVDAVFVMNWGSLAEFQHPERNAEHAREFRDWYFTTERIPTKCKVCFYPPVQLDLIADNSIVTSNVKHNRTWLTRRIAAMNATMAEVLTNSRTFL